MGVMVVVTLSLVSCGERRSIRRVDIEPAPDAAPRRSPEPAPDQPQRAPAPGMSPGSDSADGGRAPQPTPPP